MANRSCTWKQAVEKAIANEWIAKMGRKEVKISSKPPNKTLAHSRQNNKQDDKENEHKKASDCPTSDHVEMDKSSIIMEDYIYQDEETMEAVKSYIRRNLNTDNRKYFEEGIFNYETYNEVLRVKNPSVLPTTSQPISKKTVEAIIHRLRSTPIVEEMKETLVYEDLSVMKRPQKPLLSAYHANELNTEVPLDVAKRSPKFILR